MFKLALSIDFTNVTKYCMNQALLDKSEIVFIKIDFSVDRSIEEYLLLLNIAKQKEIVTLFVLRNSSKARVQDLKKLKNETYFQVKSDAIYEELKEEILGIVAAKGENDINLDIADLKTVLVYKGLAFFGNAEDATKDAIHIAIENAINNADIKDYSLNDMQAILIHFTIHPDYEIMKIAQAMELIYEYTHYDTDIIWGTTTDASLSYEYVKAVVVLTGCESQYSKQKIANNL